MRKFLLLLFIHTGICCTAQYNPHAQLRMNHLLIKDGLIEGQVYPIRQDREGYMWMGTRNGLVRYDGYTPKTYQLKVKKLNRTNVSEIYVDRSGELWIGLAYEGLYKYNRSLDSFIYIRPDSLSESLLQAGYIKTIIADSKGHLWLLLENKLKTKESVFCYNTTTHRFTRYGNEEKSTHKVNYTRFFSPIVTDNNGNIWCGSDNGLKEYDYKKDLFVEHLATKDSLLQKDFNHICIDQYKPNIIWAALWNEKLKEYQGLCKYNLNNDSIEMFHPFSNGMGTIASNTIYKMQPDAKGSLWIATDKGLAYFDVKTERFSNYALPLQDSNQTRISDFKQDKQHNFWCLIDKGLAYFNTQTNTFTIYESSSSVDGLVDYSHDMFIDNAGTLWVGTGTSGVQWINRRQSKVNIHTSKEDKQKGVQRLFYNCAEAPDHTLWFVTNLGLCHWYPAKDSFAMVSLGGKLSSILVEYNLLIDSKGHVWGGVYARNFRGLYCYDPVSRQTRTYTYKKGDTTSISSNIVGSLYEDHLGTIWVGTRGGGLCRFDQKTATFIRYPYISNTVKIPNNGKLDDKEAISIFEDKKGTLWIGTNAGSLNKFDRATNTFISFQDKTPLFRCIETIYEDSRNNLWAGTYAAGLFLVDRNSGTAKRISEKDGLLYNQINSIVEDHAGNLWLKSARGISIYNPQTASVRNLTEDLFEEDFPTALSYKTSNGLFIFSVKEGFITLKPEDFAPDTITPIVHIESVVFNKPQAKNKIVDSTIIRYGKSNIHLHYDENRISFNYVGLLYQNTAEIQYKYKLDGYDNHWINAATQRSVTYNNLAPGTYTFHVLAANSDGVWSKQGDAITIIIAPPFWQTWWFRTIVVLSMAGLVIIAVKAYLNSRLKAQQREFERQQAIEKVRSKISMDIHDEISSGLTKISLLSQRVKTRYENGKEVEPEVIDKIAGSSREVISNLGEIIWAVNPKHDNLQSLLAYIRNYAAHFFEATAIAVHICFPEEVPAIKVAPDVKHNLFLVVKEALNNIVKHAEATAVTICFEYTNENYTLNIQDNGKGMEHLNGHSFGNGLTNMKKRMEATNGSVTIHTAINKGTQLLFKGKFGMEVPL